VVNPAQLPLEAAAYGAILALWFGLRERLGRIGFYALFACTVTIAVQLVGLFLVFITLVVPALATYYSRRHRYFEGLPDRCARLRGRPCPLCRGRSSFGRHDRLCDELAWGGRVRAWAAPAGLAWEFRAEFRFETGPAKASSALHGLERRQRRAHQQCSAPACLPQTKSAPHFAQPAGP
jgi:hypothetical protein